MPHHGPLTGRNTPGPAVDGLAEVRRVLTGLSEREPPEHRSDEHFTRVGTGREEPTAQERAEPGAHAELLPLFSWPLPPFREVVRARLVP